MNRIFVFVLSAVLLGGFAMPSFAETIRIKARPGTTTGVYSFGQYNPVTCGSMARVKVKFKQPKHGKFTSKPSQGKVSAGKRCAEKVVRGIQIYYRANSGYRGSDSGKISLSMPQFVDGGGYAHRSITVKISVK